MFQLDAAFIRDSVWRQIALDKNEYTLGEMFKEAGYQSAFIGKWHLDTADQPETWAFSTGLILQLKNSGAVQLISIKIQVYGSMVMKNNFFFQ